MDAEGHWVKGHFHQGNLFGVTFRSQTKCKLPRECEHLMAKAEVADIPAEVLQGEYKSFVDTADKLARDGMEVSKLARSVSNIAYLKSAQVLGLPAHAVESSLNSLAHLVDHENRKGKAQPANLATALTALAQNLSPQQGSALNQGQHHQQQALREQLVLLMKNKQRRDQIRTRMWDTVTHAFRCGRERSASGTGQRAHSVSQKAGHKI